MLNLRYKPLSLHFNFKNHMKHISFRTHHPFLYLREYVWTTAFLQHTVFFNLSHTRQNFPIKDKNKNKTHTHLFFFTCVLFISLEKSVKKIFSVLCNCLDYTQGKFYTTVYGRVENV